MISFIICTYNSEKLIKKCLDSILMQKGKKEIIIVDGGSDDRTLEILREYKKKVIVINNKKRLPEGRGFGKWLGWQKAKGEFVAIVDHDNELSENWISNMIEPFSNKEVFGVACKLRLDKNDSLTNKYVALQGTDPFMAYRSLDGIINLRKIGMEKGRYTLVKIRKENIMITGGNCFIYRKKYLDALGGYTKDTENISRLVNDGKNILAFSNKASTHHLAVTGFLDFLRRKKRWAESYNTGKSEFSYLSTRLERKEFIVNLFYIFAILPNILVAARQIARTGEKAWIMHPLLSFITAFIYAFYTIKNKMI